MYSVRPQIHTKLVRVGTVFSLATSSKFLPPSVRRKIAMPSFPFCPPSARNSASPAPLMEKARPSEALADDEGEPEKAAPRG